MIFKTTNDLATMAYSVTKSGKPKKADCHTFIQQLATEQLSTSDIEQGLAKLYAYFMPPVPKKPKKETDWLLKAVATKDVRFYLEHLHSDGERLYATDGHRLHLFKTTDYPPGYYNAALNNIAVDHQYPDVNRVIREYSQWAHLNEIDYSDVVEISPCVTARRLKVNGKHIATINQQYWFDAISFLDEQSTLYFGNSPLEAIKIEDGDKLAVIMPLRES